MGRARALEMQSGDRRQCTEDEAGVGGDVRKLSLSPRRLPHPATDLKFPQRPSLHPRDDLPLCWRTTDASVPQPGGSGRGGPTSESAPSGGPSGLDLERGGGIREGGASPHQLGATSWQGRVTQSHGA